MWLFLEPSDVWLFRDGKPFDAGADHRANSIFPPHPTTMQGAIRRKLLVLQGVDLDDQGAVKTLVGDMTDLKNLQLRGPFVARCEANGVMPYFPCPADVVKADRDVVQLTPGAANSFAANWPGGKELSPIVYRGGKKIDAGRYWLTADRLSAYLKGEPLNEADLINEGQLFEREGRLGIGVDSDVKRPEEGLLYQAQVIRARDHVGLLVEVSGVDNTQWNRTGLLQLGGEMRATQYEVIDAPAVWPQSLAGEQRSKIYLATPACFDAGWKSNQWVLAAAALGRYQTIGGWDVATQRQKAMRRYAPAGSVYYLEQPSSIETAMAEVDRRMGFGQYFTGRW